MKKLMSYIDRFCYKHPRFGIPNLMMLIVIGNGAVWLLSAMDATGLLQFYGANRSGRWARQVNSGA